MDALEIVPKQPPAKRKRSRRALTGQQTSFIDHLFDEGEDFLVASKAAEKAGYAIKHSNVAGYRLTHMPAVREEIANRLEQRGASREHIMCRLIDLSLHPEKLIEEGVTVRAGDVVKATVELAKLVGLRGAVPSGPSTGAAVVVQVNFDTAALRKDMVRQSKRSQVPGIPDPSSAIIDVVPDVEFVVTQGTPGDGDD